MNLKTNWTCPANWNVNGVSPDGVVGGRPGVGHGSRWRWWLGRVVIRIRLPPPLLFGRRWGDLLSPVPIVVSRCLWMARSYSSSDRLMISPGVANSSSVWATALAELVRLADLVVRF